MFDLDTLFRRKKKVIKNEKFEEKIDTIEESLSKMDSGYFLQLKSTSENKLRFLDKNPDVENSLDLIQSLGFSNSENLVKRNKAIEANNKFNQAIQQACRSLDFVSQAKLYFGDHTIVISIKDMISLIKKYDLVCGNFKDYKGIVPDSNALEIDAALKKISSLCSNNRLRSDDVLYNAFKHYRPIKIEGIEYYSHIVERKLTKRESDELDLFPIILYDKRVGSGGEEFHNKTDIGKLDSIHEYLLSARDLDMPDYRSINEIYVTRPDNEYMFICAPREQMNVSARIKISYREKTDDPFIFSLSPYGDVIIHSMWGREAEDAMLEKYKNFLRRD